MASDNNNIQILSLLFLFLTFFFCINPVLSADPPGNSPSPSPHPPADVLSQPPALSPETPSPAPSPSLASPPAPPPSDLSPSPSPAPSPALTNYSSPDKSPTSSPAPAPVPDVAGDEDVNTSNVVLERDSSSGGINCWN
ncbi:unnamed protein product [Fraxinus pennsylvanica]|uniref:Uncharacterized protein n=1 Tax=Fraxinus pennsylvanica TaxID=56036 RepID=A0AAD2DPG9_9LAMI|nr:unnamed protein product [Fraxinus pennsylvanica]